MERPKLAVEIGCGYTPLIASLREDLLGGCGNLILLDTEVQAYGTLRNKGYLSNKDGFMVQGNCLSLPLGDQSVQSVFTKDSLIEIGSENFAQFRDEIDRIVVPGGYLVIMETVVPLDWLDLTDYFTQTQRWETEEIYFNQKLNMCFNDSTYIHFPRGGSALVLKKK